MKVKDYIKYAGEDILLLICVIIFGVLYQLK
jgi:hypothetical protein